MAYLDKLNREFTEAVRQVMWLSVKINDPFDRVKTMQWVRKLSHQDDTKLEMARIRNEYIHFLRIILSSEPMLFCVPFKYEPPDGELAPLTEVLSNFMVEKCPDLPKAGPMRPVLVHKTADGGAFLTVKRCPEGGVFCYLAVAPNPLSE